MKNNFKFKALGSDVVYTAEKRGEEYLITWENCGRGTTYPAFLVQNYLGGGYWTMENEQLQAGTKLRQIKPMGNMYRPEVTFEVEEISGETAVLTSDVGGTGVMSTVGWEEYFEIVEEAETRDEYDPEYDEDDYDYEEDDYDYEDEDEDYDPDDDYYDDGLKGENE